MVYVRSLHHLDDVESCGHIRVVDFTINHASKLAAVMSVDNRRVDTDIAGKCADEIWMPVCIIKIFRGSGV